MMKIKGKYLFLTAIGALLTPAAVSMAFESRGSLHFGGEWLLIALFLLLGSIGDSIKDSWCELKGSFERDSTID